MQPQCPNFIWAQSKPNEPSYWVTNAFFFYYFRNQNLAFSVRLLDVVLSVRSLESEQVQKKRTQQVLALCIFYSSLLFSRFLNKNVTFTVMFSIDLVPENHSNLNSLFKGFMGFQELCQCSEYASGFIFIFSFVFLHFHLEKKGFCCTMGQVMKNPCPEMCQICMFRLFFRVLGVTTTLFD